jgi:rhodanese-related sulfurtransferase
MRNKVDEDIPPVAAIWLQERGYDASTVVDQGMGGWKDDYLWKAAQGEE